MPSIFKNSLKVGIAVKEKYCFNISGFMKYWNIFGCAIAGSFITMSLVLAVNTVRERKPQFLPVKGVLKIEQERILLEYAETIEQKIKGLSYRQPLLTNQGMLFVNDKPTMVSLWMLGVNQNLDIFFLDNSKKITKTVFSATPCHLKKFCTIYTGEANYILELPSISKNRQLKVGETLNIEPIKVR
jgi:uncharacterized membrane protein (UPF0127 family)